jgi:hypothetical protein
MIGPPASIIPQPAFGRDHQQRNEYAFIVEFEVVSEITSVEVIAHGEQIGGSSRGLRASTFEVERSVSQSYIGMRLGGSVPAG